MNTPNTINAEKSFEYYMERLQEIVTTLQGELPLRESLDLYKEGLDCARHCREYLQQAKKDVEIWQADELKDNMCLNDDSTT